MIPLVDDVIEEQGRNNCLTATNMSGRKINYQANNQHAEDKLGGMLTVIQLRRFMLILLDLDN